MYTATGTSSKDYANSKRRLGSPKRSKTPQPRTSGTFPNGHRASATTQHHPSPKAQTAPKQHPTKINVKPFAMNFTNPHLPLSTTSSLTCLLALRMTSPFRHHPRRDLGCHIQEQIQLGARSLPDQLPDPEMGMVQPEQPETHPHPHAKMLTQRLPPKIMAESHSNSTLQT